MTARDLARFGVELVAWLLFMPLMPLAIVLVGGN